MRKRMKVNKKKSKRQFTRTAMKVKAKNTARPMRGGIRM